jgi:site-specific recombinase XerD
VEACNAYGALFDRYAAFYLQRYLDKGRKYMLKGKREDTGFLFLSRRGHPFNNTTINKCVMRPVATHLLANHVGITYIARLLGPASLRTTQRYVHVEIGDLKKMHSQYHPRERITRTD